MSFPFFQTLAEGIQFSLTTNSSRIALDVDGQSFTYEQISREVNGISQVIHQEVSTDQELIAILAFRSKTAYTGILGILLAGRGYVPLHPGFPSDRLKFMLSKADCRTILLSEECFDSFSILGKELGGLTVICPKPSEATEFLQAQMPQHKFLFWNTCSGKFEPPSLKGGPKRFAYLLYTSGSSGLPKGVAVTNENVCSYLNFARTRYQVSPEDRISQMFDMTFDLSVHDIFISILSGACLFVVPLSSLMAPGKFIKEKKLTLWFSVPSVAMFMTKMKMLKPQSFPTLRFSLFCGEALPQKSVELWQSAAPNSIIENLYGPTETTIAITSYRWSSIHSPGECLNNVVPIGWPFDKHMIRILDASNRPVQSGEPGELYFCGPQVTPGYFHSPDRTDKQFVRLDSDSGTVWYRTGDLVKQGSNGCLFFLGRLDDQIKICGFRVELQEIDRALREASGSDLAISFPHKLEHGHAEAIWAFVQAEENDFQRMKILNHCRQSLPEYMVPSKLFFIRKLPLNTNGKIDRKALAGVIS